MYDYFYKFIPNGCITSGIIRQNLHKAHNLIHDDSRKANWRSRPVHALLDVFSVLEVRTLVTRLRRRGTMNMCRLL